MKTLKPLSALLLSFAIAASAQERPALTETQSCKSAKKSVAQCAANEISTQKTYANAGKELYIESYDSASVLQGVTVNTASGATTMCSLDRKSRMFCEWVDLLDQTKLSTKAKPSTPITCHSDKELASALGLKENDISTLGIDWRFSQVIVFSPAKPKPRKGFILSQGEAFFLASAGKTGELILPFSEMCPPKFGDPTTSSSTLVAALLPNDFNVTTTKAKLTKATYDGSLCKTRP